MAEWIIADVDCVIDLRPERVNAPGMARQFHDAMSLGNREYSSLGRVTWKEAEEWVEEEERFVREYEAAQDGSKIVFEFDEWRYEDDRACAGFDLGITSTVACLRALGAMPFVSCSGGWPFSPHREQHPLVGFFAGPDELDAITATARLCGAGLSNTEPGAAMVYVKTIPHAVAFARAILNAREARTCRPRVKKNAGNGTKSR